MTVIGNANGVRRSPVPVIPKRVTGTITGAFGPGFVPKVAPPTHTPHPSPPVPTLEQQAQGEIDPMLQRLRANIDLQNKAAMTAIPGLTNSLASMLAGTDYTAPYRQAASGQAAVDAALQQSLAGQGSDLAQGLSARLAQVGEPNAVAPAAAAVAQQGQAAGNTQLATGSAALGALLANEAAAGSYGQKMPGIARLAGVQQLGQVLGQNAQTLADQTSQVESQLPGIVNDLRSAQSTAAYRQQSLNAENRRSAASIKAQNARSAASIKAENARSAATNTERKREFDARQRKQDAKDYLNAYVQLTRLGMDTTKLTQDYEHKLRQDKLAAGRLGVSRQNAATSARNAATSAQNAATSRLRADEAAAAQAEHARHDRVIEQQGARRIAQAQQRADAAILKARQKGKLHGLSADYVDRIRNKAIAGAHAAYYGWTDKDGPHDPLTYQDALSHAEAGGLPEWIYRPVIDSFYKPGGRRGTVLGPPTPRGAGG